MYYSMRLLGALILACLVAATAFAADRDAVVQRVRGELATLLKKDAAKLPIDKPVLELGADDLMVVEWVMAMERVYRVRIPDAKTVDPKSKTARKDLTIIVMASIVAEAIDSAKVRK